MLVRLALHPRRTLDAAAARPQLRSGVLWVAVTGLVSLGLGLLAVAVGGGGRAAVVLSLALPVMLVMFWLASAVIVGAGARLFGISSRRRALLAVSGFTFPPLILYAAIGVVQAASLHWGGDVLSIAVGLAALPVVGWFVVLNALAVRAVYNLPALSATAIALLPYAALSAVLLLLVVVVSVLHSAGVV